MFRNTKSQDCKQLFVSVVVAARNEEKNIGGCLKSLLDQTYPEDLYEVILVDDNSTDNTTAVAKSLEKEYRRLRLLRTTEHSKLTGKQNALDTGIRESKGEIILTTDADCRAPRRWIELMVGEFESDVGVVAGFSILDEEEISCQSLWQRIFLKLQSLETLTLYIGSIGSIARGFAWACTGNNMAYRREIYMELGGFEALGATGAEDSMLLQWIDRKSRWRVKATLTTISVKPMRAVSQYLAQRNRWASSSLQNRLSLVAFMVVVYCLNLLLPLLIVFCAFGLISYIAFAVFLSLKIIPEFLLTWKGLALFNRTDLLKYFPLLQPFHVAYVLICGIHGLSKEFVWKGRKYHEGKAESN